MKKVLFFSLMLLALVACKKKDEATDPVNPTTPDPVVETDPRDVFVGTYDLSIECLFRATTSSDFVNTLLPDSIPYTYTGEMTITKDENDASQVIITSEVYNCAASVITGNHLMLTSEVGKYLEIDLGAMTGVSLLEGKTLPVTFNLGHNRADLNDNVLTWHSDATGSGSVSVDVPILGSVSVDFTGSATLENTATKK